MMYAKRLIPKTAAAEYLGMGTSLFTRLVSQQKLPQPIRISERRIVWDIKDLDEHIETMKTEAHKETEILVNKLNSGSL